VLYLYFVYGLSFFTLGVVILFYPRRESEFPIAGSLWLVAWFAIIHGIQEWSEMVSLLPQPQAGAVARIVGLVCLPASFLCLLAFGTGSSPTAQDRPLLPRVLPAGLFALWIIITASSGQHLQAGNIWARYLLGIPATALAALALMRQVPQVARTNPSLIINLKVAAFAFVGYGIVAGMVVPDAGFFPASFVNYTAFIGVFGIPVQAVRTACALTIAASMISLLRLFTWETYEKLRRLSLRDELTGLLNRRGFVALVEQQLKIAKRQERPTLLLICDMDGLKKINDTHGHAAGDAALSEAAAILRGTFREADIVARIGGDEFAVLQVDNTPGDASATIDRLQGNLAARNAARPGHCALAMSVGAVRCAPDTALSLEQLIVQADNAMYGHKKRKHWDELSR
jgi:diguanylate cyclase (GGDEF)-like protein